MEVTYLLTTITASEAPPNCRIDVIENEFNVTVAHHHIHAAWVVTAGRDQHIAFCIVEHKMTICRVGCFYMHVGSTCLLYTSDAADE